MRRIFDAAPSGSYVHQLPTGMISSPCIILWQIPLISAVVNLTTSHHVHQHVTVCCVCWQYFILQSNIALKKSTIWMAFASKNGGSFISKFSCRTPTLTEEALPLSKGTEPPLVGHQAPGMCYEPPQDWWLLAKGQWYRFDCHFKPRSKRDS